MQSSFEKLTHLVYEAALDNSLWPELILELTGEVQRAKSSRFLGPEEPSGLAALSQHFRRAFNISEKIVKLQERESYLSSVLNSFSFGVALLDQAGEIILSNRSFEEQTQEATRDSAQRLVLETEGAARALTVWAAQCNVDDRIKELKWSGSKDGKAIIIPRVQAEQMGFPAIASAVMITLSSENPDAAAFFAREHTLTNRETQVVAGLAQGKDLRLISEDMKVTYETARSYLKVIYSKTGLSSQTELALAMSQNPLTAFRKQQLRIGAQHRVRQILTLEDGRNLEYFRLGPKTGKPVLVFDALSGVTIDMLGYPDQCAALLEKAGVQLIQPCRPGGFQSDPNPMNSLRDFAPDVRALLDHLEIATCGAFSISFGSGMALAIAHELPDRIDRLVLSSASYPEYRHKNWRELDQFYHMSAILGRHWPAMLRQVIPFLVRSILQNRDSYFDRYVKNSRSAEDIEILSHPTVRRRTSEILAQRTARGLEGMVEENLLNARGWDFDVRAIATPTRIYQGIFDNVAPVQGAEVLAELLPQGQLIRMHESGHYHHIRNWPWLVAQAAKQESEDRSLRYSIPDF